jgi:hypothetical protein
MTFRGTKRAAERELNRLVAEPGRSLRVGEADEPHHPEALRGCLDRPRRDSIGRKPIASISPYQVERYYRSLKDAGLSEGSVRYVRALLHCACKLAQVERR